MATENKIQSNLRLSSSEGIKPLQFTSIAALLHALGHRGIERGEEKLKTTYETIQLNDANDALVNDICKLVNKIEYLLQKFGTFNPNGTYAMSDIDSALEEANELANKLDGMLKRLGGDAENPFDKFRQEDGKIDLKYLKSTDMAAAQKLTTSEIKSKERNSTSAQLNLTLQNDMGNYNSAITAYTQMLTQLLVAIKDIAQQIR